MKKLKSLQFNIISEFCSDIAKGLMLAAVLGQAIFRTESLVGRVLSGLVGVSVSLLLLFLALYFSKEEK